MADNSRRVEAVVVDVQQVGMKTEAEYDDGENTCEDKSTSADAREYNTGVGGEIGENERARARCGRYDKAARKERV